MPAKPPRGEIASHADAFALDLHRALVEQLPEALDDLVPAPLMPSNLAMLGGERGVYQLFERGQSVYVGKSEQPLAERLEQHRRRCSGRLNIDVADMAFCCLYVDRFVDAVSPERILIEKFQARGQAPWNVQEGFAPKDVGRNRDHTVPGKWFLDRPVNYRAEVTVPTGGQAIPLIAALRDLAKAAPFDLFRYASTRSGSPQDREDAERDYPELYVSLPAGPAPIMDHLRAILEQLPPGWQATVLPPGVILYKEVLLYRYALAGWQRTAADVVPLPTGSRV